MNGFDPLVAGIIFAALALIPALLITSTSFLKISVVLGLVKNALGVQQIPPNIAIYSLSLILSVYIMLPTIKSIYNSASNIDNPTKNIFVFIEAVNKGSVPLKKFLYKNSERQKIVFFKGAAVNLWGKEEAADLKETDFIVIVPAFMTTELSNAFKAGFLLYLPFLIVDLIVSNLLLALGFMMVSPVMIALPLKLFLFVVIDGWDRIIHALIFSYSL